MFNALAFWAVILGILGVAFIIWAVINLVQAEDFGFLFIIGVLSIIGAVAVQADHNANQFEVQSPGQACVLKNAHPVPSAATLSTTKDDRVGPIYPCYFLLDQGIQPGVEGLFEPVPMRLSGSVNEGLFTDQNFTAEGNLGGVMLLGSGIVSGNYDAKSTTERKQVVAFMAETSGGYASFVVETGSVRYKECPADCTPSVLIWTSQEPMFTKTLGEEKDESIWLTRNDSSHAASLTPGSPGQTVQALATRIVVQLPASLMPGANSLSTN